MEINRIKEVVDLLKVANNKGYALIPEVAKELKIPKTELVQFVLDNPKLIYTENCWSYKTVNRKARVWANDPKSTYTWPESVRNKNLGLGIISVYRSAIANFRTEEWLQHQQIKQAKYIYIVEMDNYGHIYGYQVKTDTKDENDKYRLHLWRNTREKIEQLKEMGFLHEGTWYIGGFGDSASGKAENCISIESITRLKELGWTTNEFKPLNG